MSTSATLPMISPEGEIYDLPQENADKATERGFKHAVVMTSPEGEEHYIPRENAEKALGRGFKMGQPAANAMADGGPQNHTAGSFAREVATGGAGTVAPEAPAPVEELGKGLLSTFDPRPHDAGDAAAMMSGPLAPAVLPASRMLRGLGSKLKEGASEIYEGAGSPKLGLHDASIQPMDTDKMGHGLGTLGGFAAQTAMPLAEEGITRGKLAIPSTTRAGAAFKAVKAAAGDLPVDTAKYSDAILRVKELADAGGRMPTPVNKLLNRITRPDAPPVTFAEARDFYSNISRLSADEQMRMPPVIKRAVGDLRVKFGEAIADSAEKAGVGDQYRGAMKEYARAAKFKEKAIDAGKLALKGAGLGSAGYTLKRLMDLTE